MHPVLQSKARRTKPKTCANKLCGKVFTPASNAPMFVRWCSLDCGVELGRERMEKAKKRRKAKETREAKVRLKPRSKWLQEAQGAFNAYIRARDNGQPCISCQRHHTGQYHAGHYRSVGAMPSLRFNTYNVHKQCSACNNHQSGNLIDYRINLIAKIGQARVDWLEGPQETRNMDIVYLRRIKAVFSKRARHIAKLRGQS